jgi:DNA-binding transcriptional LysR family regulator
MHSLPDYVKKFMIRYPNVHVRQIPERPTGLRPRHNGEIDIGLVAVPKKDRRLEVYDFEDEVLVLACSRGTRWPTSGKWISPPPVRAFHRLRKEVPTREWIDGILSRYNTG